MKKIISFTLVFMFCFSMSLTVSASDRTFTDVKSGDYYYDAVRWAVNNGFAAGVSETEFGSGLL